MPAPAVDPAELDRELDAALAAARNTTTWSYRREGDDFAFWFPDKTRITLLMIC